MLQTEFEFSLPRGYVDAAGNLHRKGAMRLATALDEIEAVRDPRVKANEAYLSVILLSRVITRLGSLTQIGTSVIERLFSADLAYLEGLYSHINEEGNATGIGVCPHCRHRFEWEAPPVGG
jgi:hypothetical protein